MSSMFELAERIPCDMCKVSAHIQCRTKSGRPATWPHAARFNTVNAIWMDGFEDGVVEALSDIDRAHHWLSPANRARL